MTILFGGGEMGAFIPADSSTSENSTQSATFDSSFTRTAILCGGTATYADSYEFAGQTDLWIHHELYTGFNTTEAPVVVFLNSSGTQAIRLTYDVTGTGTADIQIQYNLAGTWTDIGAATSISTARQTVDWHITMGASGSVVLYLSGTQRISTGTVDLSALTDIAQVRLLGGSTTYHSQVVASSESTIGWRLTTVPPTAAGATSDFTGGYTEIDEIVYSDLDFVNSATANQVELFAHGTSVPAGYRVKAVVVTARAKRGSASGPQNIQLALRSGGTTYFSASQALDLGYGAHVAVWETDPATAAAFTSSAIASLQFGVKSIA